MVAEVAYHPVNGKDVQSMGHTDFLKLLKKSKARPLKLFMRGEKQVSGSIYSVTFRRITGLVLADDEGGVQ